MVYVIQYLIDKWKWNGAREKGAVQFVLVSTGLTHAK